MNWSELQLRIQPLDIIFFRGTDFVSGFISYLERIQTGSGDYTHVGLVINSESCPFIKELEKGKWYIWESVLSTSEAPDLITQKPRLGVQIRDLELVAHKYSGTVSWGRLLNNPWLFSQEKVIRKLKKVYCQVGQSRYNCSPINLSRAVFPKLRYHPGTATLGNLNSKTKWLFCSELVATVYVKLGILHIDPATVLPIDFLGFDQDGMKRMVGDLYQIQYTVPEDVTFWKNICKDAVFWEDDGEPEFISKGHPDWNDSLPDWDIETVRKQATYSSYGL